jgi:hypothetical protein
MQSQSFYMCVKISSMLTASNYHSHFYFQNFALWKWTTAITSWLELCYNRICYILVWVQKNYFLFIYHMPWYLYYLHLTLNGFHSNFCDEIKTVYPKLLLNHYSFNACSIKLIIRISHTYCPSFFWHESWSRNISFIGCVCPNPSILGILTIDEVLLNKLRNQQRNKYKTHEMEIIVEEKEEIYK